MEQKRIMEEDLVRILKQLTNEYPWLSARYEYRDSWATFLVSYAPSKKMFSDNDVLLRMMELEDELIDKYGDDAPLFCEEERLFSLTSRATLIENGCVKRDQESIEWSASSFFYTYSGWDKSDYQSKEYSYSLAA